MTRTREEAFEAAVDFLSNETMEDIRHRLNNIRGRLKIVDRILGAFYDPGNIDLQDCWIFYIQNEQLVLDGEEHYIVVNKATGTVTSITAHCG
jgi:hypothetical protein